MGPPFIKCKLYEYRHHAAYGLNTAANTALLVGGIKSSNPATVKNGLTRLFTQAVMLTQISDKIKFLKKFQNEQFIMGIACASLALRAPQIYQTILHGNPLSRTTALLVTTGLALQIGPPMEHMIRRACKSAWDKTQKLRSATADTVHGLPSLFRRAAEAIDHYIYNRPVPRAILDKGPRIFMSLNAIGVMANGYLQKDWSAVASGAAYLTGVGIVTAAEKYMPSQKSGLHIDPPYMTVDIHDHVQNIGLDIPE